MRSEARRRVVQIAPSGGPRPYVCDHDLDDDSDSGGEDSLPRDMAAKFHEIALAIGCTRQRVQQIESVALLKLKHALEIEARLGVTAAAPILASLRGKPLAAFQHALEDTCRRSL